MKRRHSFPGRRQAPRGGIAAVSQALAALLALLVIGRASQVGGFTFIQDSRPPKPADFPITVFTNGLPTRPFERVAFLDVHCESQYFVTPSMVSDAIPMLVRQARAAGCDAVIEIQHRQPGSQALETRTLQVTAVGVAYQ